MQRTHHIWAKFTPDHVKIAAIVAYLPVCTYKIVENSDFFQLFAFQYVRWHNPSYDFFEYKHHHA